MIMIPEVGIRFSEVDFIVLEPTLKTCSSLVVKASEIYTVEFNCDGTAHLSLKSGMTYHVTLTEDSLLEKVSTVVYADV